MDLCATCRCSTPVPYSALHFASACANPAQALQAIVDDVKKSSAISPIALSSAVMAKHYGKEIRERRIQLGLTSSTVAKASGLTIHQYYDVEQHPDEFVAAIALSDARRVCSTLGLELRGLLDLANESPSKQEASSVIRETRLAQKLSVSVLADRIGFTEDVIDSLERHEQFEDTLPTRVLFELEQVLGLDRGSLIT